MFAMETWLHVDEGFRLVVLLVVSVIMVLFIVMFRGPIGTLLVQLESLQLPFLSARFVKTRERDAMPADEVAAQIGHPVAPTAEAVSRGGDTNVESDQVAMPVGSRSEALASNRRLPKGDRRQDPQRAPLEGTGP
jgi:hypothetical protein